MPSIFLGYKAPYPAYRAARRSGLSVLVKNPAIKLVVIFVFVLPLCAVDRKEPSALSVTARAMAANGGNGAARDSIAIGELTYGSKTLSVVLKTSGNFSRVDVTDEKGTQTILQVGDKSYVTSTDGKANALHSVHSLLSRAPHVPLLSILGELDRKDLEMKLVGTEIVNGVQTDVISIALVPDPQRSDAASYRRLTERRFYIDQATGLVVKTAYIATAENHPESQALVEVFYSDYRMVNGIEVPFLQTTTRNGKPQSVLKLSAIQFNKGLSSEDFQVPEVR
jgi:hypothetical protein